MAAERSFAGDTIETPADDSDARSRPAPPTLGDALVWIVSVIAVPAILRGWLEMRWIVVWAVVHTIAFWWYVVGRASHHGVVRWHAIRMASSVAVWCAVPLSALATSNYAEHEALLLLVGFAFVSTRAIVPLDDHRFSWEIDGAIVGALTAVSSIVVGRPALGIAAAVATAFYLFAEQSQIALHSQARRDRAERAEAFERLSAVASTDQLTGLGNRRAAIEWLHERASGTGMVLIFDIDRFKQVNDRFGHQAGDVVLIQVAEQVSAQLGDAWSVFRLGGDEFIALTDHATEATKPDLTPVAVSVVAYDGTPTLVDVHLSGGLAAVGLPLTLDEATRPVAAAMRAAKREHGTVVVAATDGDDAEDAWNLSLRVLDALDAGAFEWWGQPVVDLKTGFPVAVELLCRWKRDGGLVLPAEFLGVISTFDRQRELGMQTVAAAADWFDALDQAGFAHLGLTINVPPSHLVEGLVDDLRGALDPLRIGRLGVEVLESEILHVTPEVVAAFDQVRDAGIEILVDDFGAGHTAFSNVSDLPFDAVKLNRAMIHEVDGNGRRASILRGLAPVFDQLGITTVAKGIETSIECEAVRSAGIAQGQGWLIARPEPIEDCVATLHRLAQSQKAAPIR